MPVFYYLLFFSLTYNIQSSTAISINAVPFSSTTNLWKKGGMLNFEKKKSYGSFLQMTVMKLKLHGVLLITSNMFDV